MCLGRWSGREQLWYPGVPASRKTIVLPRKTIVLPRKTHETNRSPKKIPNLGNFLCWYHIFLGGLQCPKCFISHCFPKCFISHCFPKCFISHCFPKCFISHCFPKCFISHCFPKCFISHCFPKCFISHCFPKCFISHCFPKCFISHCFPKCFISHCFPKCFISHCLASNQFLAQRSPISRGAPGQQESLQRHLWTGGLPWKPCPCPHCHDEEVSQRHKAHQPMVLKYLGSCSSCLVSKILKGKHMLNLFQLWIE